MTHPAYCTESIDSDLSEVDQFLGRTSRYRTTLIIGTSVMSNMEGKRAFISQKQPSESGLVSLFS